MEQFERIVDVWPAYDKRSNIPSENYGIGSCKIVFLLRGPAGAIQFMLGTNWFLPETQRENRLSDHSFNVRFDKIEPQGWDVGYHSYTPMYEGQNIVKESCAALNGAPCYYDGSSLLAEDYIEPFLQGGTAWLWPKLEKVYYENFHKEEI